MASAHAKFTGGVGLCYATSGPGAIHLLNGLYDAKMDNQPVVAIVGQQARSALGAHYQQEVDLVSLVQGRRERLCRHRDGARPGAAHGGPRRAHRAEQAFRHLHHPAQRSATDGLRGSAACARHDAYGRGISGRKQGSGYQRPAGRRRGAEQGQEGRHAGRRRVPRSDRRSDRGGGQAGRGRGEGAARQGRGARRSALRHRRAWPSRHKALMGPDEGLRHVADGRLRFPLQRVPAEARAARAACRSTSRAKI